MYKIILFGDSITAGYYHQEVTDLLTTRISQAFPLADVINAGIPGNTTVDALERIDRHVLTYEPDYVTVFFGANDMATHHLKTSEDYRDNLQKIIDLIGREKIILVSPPANNPLLHVLDRPEHRLEKYVEVAKEVAEQNDIPFVPLFDEMKKQESLRPLLQEDGLHFSEEGYDLLALLMNRALREKIKEGEKD